MDAEVGGDGVGESGEVLARGEDVEGAVEDWTESGGFFGVSWVWLTRVKGKGGKGNHRGPRGERSGLTLRPGFVRP